jgi:hypothetical protein
MSWISDGKTRMDESELTHNIWGPEASGGIFNSYIWVGRTQVGSTGSEDKIPIRDLTMWLGPSEVRSWAKKEHPKGCI